MKKIILLVLLTIAFIPVWAQTTGKVTDKNDGLGVPYANIYLKDIKMNVSCDAEGNFTLPKNPGKKMIISSVGYEKRTIDIPADSYFEVTLKSQETGLQGVTVKGRRARYRKKDNPAVALMRRVIEHKKTSHLELLPFYEFTKYQKITLSQDNVDTLKHKRKPWYIEHIEKSPIDSSRLILPLTVDETVTKHIYRKSPHRELDILDGQRSAGVNKIFQTGEMVNVMLKEIFQDVNIYDDYVRVLQYPFPSPIGRTAISFYHFYIQDSVVYKGDSCWQVLFYPANQQDFGFKGQLLITKDSAVQVKYCELVIPKKSDVNFVDNMNVVQSFAKLPNGMWVLDRDEMTAEMKLLAFAPKLVVTRKTTIGDYTFTDENPPRLLRGRAPTKEMPSARIRGDEYWETARTMPLTKGESNMDYFVYRLTKSKNFGWAQLVLKMFAENFVETSKPGHRSKFDVGPVNTIVSHNFVDGYRLRLSGRTMAALNPHFFLKGFGAYGTDSHKWYYGTELTWSFNKKENSPFEFPVRSLTLYDTYDLMSPSDKYLLNNKDNIFESFRTQSVRQMYYYSSHKLEFNYETEWGLSYKASVNIENDRPTGDLHFIPVAGIPDAQGNIPEVTRIHTSEFSATIGYCPNQSYINTKQRRYPTNFDSPEFSITHTMGVKGFLGGDYNSNMTEVSAYKRQWLGSWGYINMHVIGRAQWNKVPFPLLCMPPVSLNYFTDVNDVTFNLMRNMEFLNDRYVYWSALWDLNGKLFNRIPLIKKLKWREFIGVKGMWGHITDKNNPTLHPDDPVLFQLPASSHIMSNQPYWEGIVGVHNIFKFFGVDYVRRLTYKNLPDVDKWGIRFNFMMTF
ncbi:DUF5686 and carboxypeptidase-like regulatory domain-containing protein [Prevotella lacticifex]|uniref:DUF5686 and carboxypeptidase-like regulatory domain-containing protein n=1 Tax=Prevotella lacticifex TaxID=2854755 RepID=UPI001CC3CE04|nr:DUF5686 and carboxypeptidase-like regulatory domain-containing protein [Prevotella lacticifex]